MKNRLVEGTPFAPYTYGYNSPLIIQRARDVLAALRYARSTATRTVSLVGLGAEAGTWAALARAAAPSLLDRAAIDTGGFRFATVAPSTTRAFLPGGAKYDDLPGFLALAAPSPCGSPARGPNHRPSSPRPTAPRDGSALTVSPLRGPQATADAVSGLCADRRHRGHRAIRHRAQRPQSSLSLRHRGTETTEQVFRSPLRHRGHRAALSSPRRQQRPQSSLSSPRRHRGHRAAPSSPRRAETTEQSPSPRRQRSQQLLLRPTLETTEQPCGSTGMSLRMYRRMPSASRRELKLSNSPSLRPLARR